MHLVVFPLSWLPVKGKLRYLSGEGDLGGDLVLCCHLVSSQGLVLHLPVLVESAFGFGTQFHRHLQQIKAKGWWTHKNSTVHQRVDGPMKLYCTTPELYCTSKGWWIQQNSTVHQRTNGHSRTLLFITTLLFIITLLFIKGLTDTSALYCTSKGWRTLQNSTVHQRADGHTRLYIIRSLQFVSHRRL